MDENVTGERETGTGKKVNRLVALGFIKEKSAKEKSSKEELKHKVNSPEENREEKTKETNIDERNGGQRDQRKKQIELGRKIESMYNEVFLNQKGSEVPNDFWEEDGKLEKEVKSAGRPKVSEYNFKKLTVSLPLKYAEFLNRVEIAETSLSIKGAKMRTVSKRANEGLGSRMRKIIDHYLVYSQREREQVKVLVQILGDLEKDLKLFISKYKRNEYFEDLEEINSRMKKKFHQFELVCDILKLNASDLKNLLTPTQFENWQLVYSIVNKKQNDSPESFLLNIE